MADGGANAFFDMGIKDYSKIREIVGDLDSIRPDVLAHFSHHGVKINHIEDQNYNDFEKAIMSATRKGWNTLATVGVFGSRMDHTLASMSIALKQSRINPKLQLFLVS